jgi:hypothetical protein
LHPLDDVGDHHGTTASGWDDAVVQAQEEAAVVAYVCINATKNLDASAEVIPPTLADP